MKGKYQKGKATCKILRQIRQQIADENDIPLVTKECTYQGDCKGTCPKCEAELRYLEEQLARRKKMGKRVAVAAIATTLLAGAGGAYAVNAIEEKLFPGPTAGALAPIEQLVGEIEADPIVCETTEPETVPAETTAPETVPTETAEPDARSEREKEWDDTISGMLYIPAENQDF